MTTQWTKLMIVLVAAGAVAFAGCVQEEETTGEQEGMGDTGAGGAGNDTMTENEDGIGEPSSEGIGTDGMEEDTAVTPAGP